MGKEERATIALAIACDAVAPYLTLPGFTDEEKEQIFQVQRLLTAKIDCEVYTPEEIAAPDPIPDDVLYDAIDVYLNS
jgi:hypothetical protein